LKKVTTSKYFGLLSLMIILILSSACTQSEESDISSIIHDKDNYNIETSPYEDEIKFTLSSDKRLDESDEPIRIAKIYDTTIYVTEIRENNWGYEILVQAELKNDIHPTKGTVLSVRRITDGEMKLTGGITAYDDKGNRPKSGGKGVNSATERMHFDTHKSIYMETGEWTFKIEGLNVIKYKKK